MFIIINKRINEEEYLKIPSFKEFEYKNISGAYYWGHLLRNRL